MRLLDASPRKVLLSLSLAFASLAGIHCSHPNQTPIQLDRATRSASLHIRSAHVTDQERLQIRGTIFSHTTTEVGRFKGGLVHQGKDNRAPVPHAVSPPERGKTSSRARTAGDILCGTYPSSRKTVRRFWSTVVLSEENLIFAHIQQNIVPRAGSSLPLQIRGNGEVAYRESGRIQGLCEGVLAERELKVRWEGRNFTLAPGSEVRLKSVETGEQPPFLLTLVQNNDLVEGDCSLDPPYRSEIVVLPSIP